MRGGSGAPGWGAAVVLCCAVAVAGAAPARALTLSLAQARNLAFAELQKQDYAKALRLTDALLAKNPKDAAALIIRSQALRGLGRLDEAVTAARAGFAAADSMSLHYGAALAMAQALSLQGHRTWAQLWLRRANHYATTDFQRHRVASDYAYVRSQNPLKLSFTASVQPSNNVNNGSSHSTWVLYNPLFGYLPYVASPASQALSGVMSDLGVSGQYVLEQGQRRFRALTFGASDHSVVLSPGAQALAPSAKGSDYRYDSLSGGLLQRDLLAPNGTILTSQLTLSRAWYGSVTKPCPPGNPGCTPPTSYGALSDDVAASFQLSRPTGPGQLSYVQLNLERNLRLDKAISSDSVYGLSGGAKQALAGGDQFQVSAGFARHNSQDINVDHMAVTLGLSYSVGRPIAGIRWSGSVNLEADDYAQSFVSPNGRHDKKLTVAASAEFTQASIYGFSPVLTLSVSRNASNIDTYDTRDTGIGLSFQSRF